MKKWFAGLTRGGKILVISVASVVGLGTIGSFAEQPQSSTVPIQQAPAAQSAPTLEKPEAVAEPKPVITKKEVVEKSSVGFKTSTVDDPTLTQGATRVATEGVAGTREITYEVTYEDGKEVSRSEVRNIITQQPIDKVVQRGTKAPAPSCPNGTYVNAYGNTVCRPYETNSAPAGATARCSDGTYSFSQSRRGTCSRHGGVAQWL